MNEFEQGFKNHEEAQKYMEENVERNTPTEMTYKDDSGFGRGKYKYMIKEWHPTVHTFKTRGQAYWFLRNNPEIIDSDLIEF
jgi:viroplasmin and RNaseH domain-containing protein